MTAAGIFADWERKVQHWSTGESVVFTFLIVIGMAVAIVVVIYGGAWILTWPKRLRESRLELIGIRSGLLRIEVTHSRFHIADRLQAKGKSEIRSRVFGIHFYVINPSLTTPISLKGIHAVSVLEGGVLDFLDKIDEHHPPETNVEDGGLLQGEPLDETAYIPPNGIARGVVNFLEKNPQQNETVYVVAEDIYETIYQINLTKGFQRVAEVVREYPWEKPNPKSA